MSGSVIVSGARTPIGKLSGSLAGLSAVELGATAIAEALARGGLLPEAADMVIMGQVLQAGQGQNPARQAAVRAGVPTHVSALTVNKVCLSGLEAVHIADLMIRAGEAEVVVAGGMESMTLAPYVLPGGRAGFRFGDQPLRDAIMMDGLTCAFDSLAMGESTDRYASKVPIGRREQDEVAVMSHERASAAVREGRISPEVVETTVPGRNGEATVAADEGIRGGSSLETLARLPPAFAPDGTVTAGNSSQLSDGAAAVVLASGRLPTAWASRRWRGSWGMGRSRDPVRRCCTSRQAPSPEHSSRSALRSPTSTCSR